MRQRKGWAFKKAILRLRKGKGCLVVFLALFNACLWLGAAFAMSKIESPHEQAQRVLLAESRAIFDEILANCSNSLCPDLYSRAKMALNQTMILEKELPSVLTWDLKGGMVYSATVMSTIGYGFLHPVTHDGQLFTVVFAFVGIPSLYLFLSLLSDYLVLGCRWLNKHTLTRFGGSFATRDGGPRQRYTLLITATVMFSYLFGIAAFYKFLSPSSSSRTTPSTYVEAFYFAFTTFSTIGFGDFLVKDKVDGNAADNAVAAGFLLSTLMGLVVLVTMISVIQNGIERMLAKADYVIITTAESADDSMVHVVVDQESKLEEAWARASEALLEVPNSPWSTRPRSVLNEASGDRRERRHSMQSPVRSFPRQPVQNARLESHVYEDIDMGASKSKRESLCRTM